MSWKEVWPQTLQSPKNRINIEKNDNSLVASLKQIIVAVAWFPPHSDTFWAPGGLRPTPCALSVPGLQPPSQGRAGRSLAVLPNGNASPRQTEHGGWEVQRLKCRESRRAGSLALGTLRRNGSSCGTKLTARKEACRAQSPFPWTLVTPLSETVHCQQLPQESSGLKDVAHEGRKRV